MRSRKNNVKGAPASRRHWVQQAFSLLFFFLLSVSIHAADLNEDFLEAARKGDAAAVKSFLAKGANVNAKNKYGTTALMFAASKGHLEVAKLLVEHGADIDAKDSFYNSNAIDLAVSWNHNEIVKLLLDKGAKDVNDALGSAIYKKNYEVAGLILENAELNPDLLAEALADATDSGDQKMVDILKKAGAKPIPWEVANIEPEILKTYTGNFTSDRGDAVITLKENSLILQYQDQSFTLSPIDATNFKPVEVPTGSIQFTKNGQTVDGFTLKYGPRNISFTRKTSMEFAPSVAQAPTPQAAVESSPKKKSKASNWPSFRGIRASGIADGQNPPLKWDATKSENIVWKTPIPGLAHSSPVIWEDRVFITTAISSDPKAEFRHGLYGDVDPSADLSKHSWRVYCLDRRTGKILWERVANEGIPKIKRHPKSSQATLKGDAESNQFVAWSKKRGGPYMPTPIVYGDCLYTCANNGVVTCYNAKTGEKIYQQRLGGKGSAYAFTASPVAADGKIFFTSEDGEIFVVKAGPAFEILATNSMGEVCMATPAISDRMLILRTQHHVYGIMQRNTR